MVFQVCIDIGGTFTDCLVSEGAGEIRIFKAPTTPGAFHVGFMEVLKVAAEGYGRAAGDFISEIEMIVHGTTVSTNALVEGKVATVGLIVNAGHADVLVLREGPRKGAFEWRLDYPDPFVPRRLTRTVGGRIDARGRELVALDEADVGAAVDHFRRMQVQAIAVGLLWSIANGDHERRVGEIVAAQWPEVPVTLSHRLNPIPREYRRIISAATDAALYPIVSDYIAALQRGLTAAGFGGELLMANCVGGMMPPADMVAQPIYSVMSGPTLAPIAAQALTPERDVIVGDMGGTTFDVSALRDHQLIVTPEAYINDDMLGIPKVDIRSIGAGGGSIAWVDVGGLLRVGPESAGAEPGPACYAKGGTAPTVTDANVLLGILDPGFFLGGRIALDRAAAEGAVGTIAERLGIGLLEAAYAIHTTSNHNMVAAIEDITVREGINPRDSYFVSGGGGTACHIAEMVDILGLKRYMMPKLSAGLSAFGGLISDIRREVSGTLQTDGKSFERPAVNRLLARLRADGDRFLEGAGVPVAERSFAYMFMGRYLYQSWEIEVRFEPQVAGPGDGSGDTLEDADVPRLVDAFHRMHERIYSIKDEADTVEFTTWKVRATGHRRKTDLWRHFTLPRQDGPVRPKGHRTVYLQTAGGMIDLPVYDGEAIGAGGQLTGPCIVEEATFTALLLAGHEAVVDDHGNYLVEVARTAVS